MVREAVGESENSKAKVLYKGVDVGNVMDIMRNQDIIETLLDEIIASVAEGNLLEFTVDGTVKHVAFRN